MTNDEGQAPGGLLPLALLALVAGALAGLVGAIFRLSLQEADHLRDGLIGWAHGQEAVDFFLVLAVCGGATAVAAWLVRRHSPHAAGSGIPHVEAVLRGELPQAPFNLIPVKFFGGLLAIGAGLALGGEGPSVQMGASLAHLVGKVFHRGCVGCGRGWGGPWYGFQRANRGSRLRSRGIGVTVRASYRHRRPRGLGDCSRGGARAAWRCAGLPRLCARLWGRRNQTALFRLRCCRGCFSDCLQPRSSCDACSRPSADFGPC
jgi:Voltage gated chloride channel